MMKPHSMNLFSFALVAGVAITIPLSCQAQYDVVRHVPRGQVKTYEQAGWSCGQGHAPDDPGKSTEWICVKRK